MEAILMSIKPEWSKLVAGGKKTVEVRKNRPKLETPFKVFVYCTNGGRLLYKSGYNNQIHLWQIKEHETTRGALEKNGNHVFNGKVIGEFVCNRIDHLVHSGTCRQDKQLIILNSDLSCSQLTNEYLRKTYLTLEEIEAYSKGGDVYAWYITNLVIYDEPKELSEFFKEGDCEGGLKCKTCPYSEKGNEAAGLEDDCIAPFDTTKRIPLTRPPQSWCYVEEVN